VRHEVEYQSDIAVGIPFLMHKLPDLRKLVQASSWACADFCPGTSGPLATEPSLLHDPVDLIAGVAPQVEAFDLLPVLVEEDKVRIVVRDEVHLQSRVRVSMPCFLDEAAGLR